MTRALAGQLIGSIRRVWFVPAGAPEWIGTPDPAEPLAASTGAIEIETKAGRFAHLIVEPDLDAIRLCAGAARAPVGAVARRQWRDLTAVVPAAFDGRPAITAVIPVDPVSAAAGNPAARVWRLDLSTGAALWCRRSAGALELGVAPG